MFAGFDWNVIWRSLPYLFREGMTFTLTLTVLAMSLGVGYRVIIEFLWGTQLNNFAVIH